MLHSAIFCYTLRPLNYKMDGRSGRNGKQKQYIFFKNIKNFFILPLFIKKPKNCYILLRSVKFCQQTATCYRGPDSATVAEFCYAWQPWLLMKLGRMMYNDITLVPFEDGINRSSRTHTSAFEMLKLPNLTIFLDKLL